MRAIRASGALLVAGLGSKHSTTSPAGRDHAPRDAFVNDAPFPLRAGRCDMDAPRFRPEAPRLQQRMCRHDRVMVWRRYQLNFAYLS